DLFYCYAHMTPSDLRTLDTLEGPDYMEGYLSDEDLDIPPGTKPPNPEESELLPSVVHPSYPFGNPLSIKHPASRPKRPFEPSSRALFEDMVPLGAGVNGFLRWKELGLDTLLPVDEEAETKVQAEQARKMANGVPAHQQSTAPPPRPIGMQRTVETQTDEEGDEEDTEGGDEEDEDEEVATEVDEDDSLRIDSQDLLSSDY
ncbi:hypothetical protein BDM02DRAFT_3095196, partial [Thelephora ganbajun]